MFLTEEQVYIENSLTLVLQHHCADQAERTNCITINNAKTEEINDPNISTGYDDDNSRSETHNCKTIRKKYYNMTFCWSDESGYLRHTLICTVG